MANERKINTREFFFRDSIRVVALVGGLGGLFSAGGMWFVMDERVERLTQSSVNQRQLINNNSKSTHRISEATVRLFERAKRCTEDLARADRRIEKCCGGGR